MKKIYLTLTMMSLLFCVYSQNPLIIPDTLSGNTINLNLQQGTMNFYPGQATNTFGVNGNILGPTLILHKGSNVSINIHNDLPDTSTVHWHGMHVSAVNDGGPWSPIAPATTCSINLNVMDWAGTYWYHPHMCMHTNEQVQKGIAGFVIVKDSVEEAITLPRTYGVDDFPIVIQTKTFDTANQVIIHSNLDTSLLVNATLHPYLNIPAQVVRLRLLNGSSERVYNLGFTGNKTFYQIGSDGGLLTCPVSLTRLRLAPGERAEILIDLSSYMGQSFDLISFASELPNGIYGATRPGMMMMETLPDYSSNPLNGADFTVLHLNVVAATANAVTTIPTTLTSHNPWLESSANTTRQLVITPVNMGPSSIEGPFVINGMTFDMMMINYYIPLNNIEIWEVVNHSHIAHPFHIHDEQFYILDDNGNPPPLNEQGRKDVVLVRPMHTVRFITRFEDFSNDTIPYMYHCHMLTHEDDGMMGQFIVNSVTTGITDLSAKNNLEMYPDPCSKEQTLKINSEIPIREISVTNIIGEEIYNQTVNGKSVDINPSLGKGIYLVTIKTEKETTTRKLVID